MAKLNTKLIEVPKHLYNDLCNKYSKLQSENKQQQDDIIYWQDVYVTVKKENEELKEQISYYNFENGKQSAEIERLTIMNKLLAGHKKALEKELKRLRR